MHVDGKCHCGEIAFTADVEPAQVGICHCADCQELSGSPYRITAQTQAKDFSLLKGAPKTYLKTSDSGGKWAIAFCSNCGTPIYAAPADDPTFYALRVGTLKQRSLLPPNRQIWCESALPWAMVEDVEKINRQ
jgi:hypothetical protein